MANKLTQRIDTIKKDFERLPREAFDYFVSITPRDKGNARSKTRLRGNTIVADYPYAVRLDEGWSKQAPDGMVKPTEEFIARRIDQISKGR